MKEGGTYYDLPVSFEDTPITTLLGLAHQVVLIELCSEDYVLVYDLNSVELKKVKKYFLKLTIMTSIHIDRRKKAVILGKG